ncbi:hypothetical protein SALBM135S_05603 [Streptomyces alboniger]
MVFTCLIRKTPKSLWVLEECGEYPTVTGLSRITPPTLKTPELKDLNEPHLHP